MGHVILTASLLLLIQSGTEVAALTISSTSTGNVLTGNNISLDISFNGLTSSPDQVSWTINNVIVAYWTPAVSSVFEKYIDRLKITGNGSLLIINSNKNDTGSYIISVLVLGKNPVSQAFQVKIYDPVVNVTVTQSPQSVNENTAVVDLTCSASGDIELVTWMRNGTTLGYNDTYSLQNENKTLQLKNPDRTYTGNYTCYMSSPVSRNNASWELIVSQTDSLSGGAIAGIVIGSVFGALLLITLIVLLVYCIRKRKPGNQKKTAEPQHKDVLRTVSGNTLSPDDPAYFTMNSIMYRNSSISMGSYNIYYDDNMHDIKVPSSPSRVKHATQV